jgi:molybdopterin-guanine dinucleotide biosynthesis protein A
MDFDAIVLAGGAGRRLGGADKPAVAVGDRSLLDRVLDAVAAARCRVVVGPPRALPAGVIGCREEPPRGGPAAALAAGVPHTRSAIIVVLAADLPWIAPAVPVLTAALSAGADVAALAGTDGRLNLLAAAWQRPALVDALRRIGEPAGRAMGQLAANSRVCAVVDPAGWGADCDTWEDMRRATERLKEGSRRR